MDIIKNMTKKQKILIVCVVIVVVSLVLTLFLSGTLGFKYGFSQVKRQKHFIKFNELIDSVNSFNGYEVDYFVRYEDNTQIKNHMKSYGSDEDFSFIEKFMQTSNGQEVSNTLYISNNILVYDDGNTVKTEEIDTAQINELSQVKELNRIIQYVIGFSQSYIDNLYYFEEDYTMYKAEIDKEKAQAFFGSGADNMQIIVRYDGDKVQSIVLSYSLQGEIDNQGQKVPHTSSLVSITLKPNNSAVIIE